MQLTLVRYSDNGNSTAGLLFLDGEFFCHTLEDERRDVKVAGETRIPEGNYQVLFREVLSPLTKKYRSKFDWFTWHLQLQDVPNFNNVYMHIGNRETETDGCLLLGDSINNNRLSAAFLGNSTPAFARMYKLVSAELEAGNPVHITIKTNAD